MSSRLVVRMIHTDKIPWMLNNLQIGTGDMIMLELKHVIVTRFLLFWSCLDFSYINPWVSEVRVLETGNHEGSLPTRVFAKGSFLLDPASWEKETNILFVPAWVTEGEIILDFSQAKTV